MQYDLSTQLNLYFRLSLFLLIVLMCGLQSCSTSQVIPPKRSSPIQARTDIRTDLVQTASKYLGTVYLYGGKDRRGFDCSGLVSKVFFENKIDIRGNSNSLASKGRQVGMKDARKGDLIFFKKQNKINHVALITDKKNGELWVIHSTSSRGVIKENIFASSYWSSKKYFIKDLL